MEQEVFDNPLLRQTILYHLESLRHKERMYSAIQDLVTTSIANMWFRYCSCTHCQALARSHIEDH